MSNTATDTTIKILSRHATLSEAVKASGIDLSYNPQAAQDKIRQTERAHRDGYKSGEAFVTDDGVYYVYQADIKLLNRFEPFGSCLDDSNFAKVSIIGDEIIFSKRVFPKASWMRKQLAQLGIMVG